MEEDINNDNFNLANFFIDSPLPVAIIVEQEVGQNETIEDKEKNKNNNNNNNNNNINQNNTPLQVLSSFFFFFFLDNNFCSHISSLIRVKKLLEEKDEKNYKVTLRFLVLLVQIRHTLLSPDSKNTCE